MTITLFLLHFKDAVPFSSGFHYFWEGFYFSLITLLEVIFSSGCIKKISHFGFLMYSVLFSYRFESVVWYLSSLGGIFSASCFGCCSILLLLWDHSYHMQDFHHVTVFLACFCVCQVLCLSLHMFLWIIFYFIISLLSLNCSLLSSHFCF